MRRGIHGRRALALLMGSALALLGLVTPAATATLAQENDEQITITHAQGETTVDRNPGVVLSFDLASVDTLDTLGVEIAGLPKASLGGDLERFDTDEYLDIGTLFEPDYERVHEAQPDLIIVAGRSSDAYGELSNIAPTIDLTASGDDFIEDLTTNTMILAEIFDVEDEATAILDDITAQVDSLRADAEGAGTGLVIMTTGGNVTALAPGGNRGGVIYDTLGIEPPIEDIEEATHGEPISFEFLLDTNPDWLFVMDRDTATGETGGETAEQVLDNELVHETTAWRDDQVVYLDPYDWYIVGAGLSTTQSMLNEIDAALND